MLKNLKAKTDTLQKDKTQLTGEVNLIKSDLEAKSTENETIKIDLKRKLEEFECLQMKADTLEKVKIEKILIYNFFN